MALYILDTDIFSLWAAGHPTIDTRIKSHPATEIATSIMTVEEALVGWLTALRRARTNDQREFVYDRMTKTANALARVSVVSCSRAALDRYDQLDKMKLNVGGYDLRIAAIALEAGAIMVTHNLSDFRRGPGLVCEDWSV